MEAGTVKFKNLVNRMGVDVQVNSLDVNILTIDNEKPKQIVEILVSELDKLVIVRTSKGYHLAEEYKLASDVPFVREWVKFDLNFIDLGSEIKNSIQKIK